MRQQISHVEHITGLGGEFRDLSSGVMLAPELTNALHDFGIRRFYKHQVKFWRRWKYCMFTIWIGISIFDKSKQADAIEAALRGGNVCICTATSSGKSLTYNVPVIQVAIFYS